MSNITKLRAEQNTPSLPTQAALMAAEKAAQNYMARISVLDRLPRLSTPGTYVSLEVCRHAALKQREQLMSRDACRELARPLQQGLRMPPTPDVAKMVVGQLLTAYPTSKIGNPEAFFETLVFDLVDEGIPDIVMAAACQQLRRTSRFLPAIAEVIEACRSKKSTYTAICRGHMRYHDKLDEVHNILHLTGGDPDAREADWKGHHGILAVEYMKGAGNEYWYDPWLNPDLMERDGEGDEEYDARILALKAAAKADPETFAIREMEARGRRDGHGSADENRLRAAADPLQFINHETMRLGKALLGQGLSSEHVRVYVRAYQTAFEARVAEQQVNRLKK
ncbi:hypothetical protein AB4Y85_18060 [Microvirga sp. 2YAF29]|uniref:hypothetical protein n=1 Tax=Microvirga sp. 2YAF29 TaxID=3233031 RepID=UPI003F977701